ncbi:DUF4055 domain-containing protein [Comamonas sp. 4034]|uniref:DUF4055 domain-containing protein n=1 Tax=Comamonas sp. 4034 TaxID=3156455 RepID=UPI003D24BC5F
MAIQVNQLDAPIARMVEDWAVIDALLGGTPAMRKAKKYLPQQPREDDADYQYRLSTSTLFPAFERTLAVMAGKPFSKEITVGKNVPVQVQDYLPNIDDNGASLHSFASKVFRELVSHGFGGVLVDFTKTDGENRTQADEKAMGARPYWVQYKHNQILGVRYKKGQNGLELVMVRLLEISDEEDGDYGSQQVKRVRVLRPGSWEVHKETSSGWEIESTGTTTLSYIPFALLVAGQIGPTEGRPPLKDLAYLNVKHWQQQSDQDDSVRFARKRLLVFTGVDEGELQTPSAGAAYALRFGDKDAKAEVIQGSAESVTVGRTELEALEDQMIQTGAELLVAKPGQRTATEASNDAEANKSSLQSLTEDFEDVLDRCLQFTADWIGAGEGGSVSLFKDFGAATLSDASAQLIVAMVQAGLISKETGLKELQRRGVLAPDLDVKLELSSVEAEGPALGAIGDA